MFRRLRGRINSAHVLAAVALFVALGGSAVALQRNSVGTRALKPNAVKGTHIKANRVKSKHVRNRGLRGIDLRQNSVKGRHVDESTLTGVRAGNVVWAVVNDRDGNNNARVVRASRAGVTATEGNVARVNFGFDVSRCAWLATRGSPNVSSEPRGYAQTRGGGSSTVVRVPVRNANGGLVDGDFHLAVIC